MLHSLFSHASRVIDTARLAQGSRSVPLYSGRLGIYISVEPYTGLERTGKLIVRTVPITVVGSPLEQEEACFTISVKVARHNASRVLFVLSPLQSYVVSTSVQTVIWVVRRIYLTRGLNT